MIENWAKFKLHLWKNLNVHWNHGNLIILALLTPTFYCALIAVFRCVIPVETLPNKDASPNPLKYTWSALIGEMQLRHEYVKNKTGKDVYNVFMPRNIIAYAPDTYEAFKNIMEHAKYDLEGIDLIAFDACAKLRETMQKEFYFAGVCFDDSVMNMSTDSIHLVGIYPNHLTMSLVFPSELRIYNTTHISANWNTDKLYYIKSRTDYVNPHRHPEGIISYLREGFVIIQHAVSLAYIGLITNKTKSELPRITLEKFPDNSVVYDNLTNHMEISLSFIIMTSYITPVMYLLKFMLVEKERRTVRLMNLLYVRHSLQFLAWLVCGNLSLCAACIPVLILFKINWNDGYGILNNTSTFVVLQFFLAYNVSILCFSYAIGNFFTRATTGICVTSLVLITSYIPYFVIFKHTAAEKTLLCGIAYLFPNSVLGLALQTIIDYEVNNHVLDLRTVFTPTDAGCKLSFGAYILVCYGQAILYGSIALIVPEINVYIIPDRVKTFLRAHFSAPIFRRSTRASTMSAKTRIYEVEPNHKQIFVEFSNVCKEINDEVILQDISFYLYEDECTVLMGHNGSGKTILMNIAAGLLEPTSGSVFINSSRVQDNTPHVRRSIGVCISDGLLFDGLTVEDQLKFFCKIRALNERQTKAEVRKYLKAMELEDKRYVLTQDLTQGLRFHLALCTAMVGGTKVVILDEPSSTNDLSTRKLMWELLYREKKGRAILMVSHSPMEAESIADRILILSKGALQCSGSTEFLRNLYGQGYRLVIHKGPDCQSDAVTALFRKYIRNISPASDFCAELSYIIHEKYEDIIVPLVAELNLYLNELDIRTFSLKEVSIEDVFYNVGADKPANGDPTRFRDILNGISPFSERKNSYVFLKPQFSSKFQRWSGQWHAMLYKNYITIKFYRNEVLTCLLAVVIYVYASFALLKNKTSNLPPIAYELAQYETTEIIVDSRQHKTKLVSEVEEMYVQAIFWYPGINKIHDSISDNFVDYIRTKLREDIFTVRMKYVIAVTFSQNSIIAWFNNLILHTAPLSLNMVFAALLQALLDSNAKIVVIFDPLPFSTACGRERHLKLTETHLNLGNFLGTNIAFCLCYMGALAFTYLIEERASRFKLMQLLSGLSISTFWFSAFCFSFLKLLFGAMVVLIAIWFTSDEVFRLPNVMGMNFLIFMVSGTAIISINFAFSFTFNDKPNAYILITTYHAIGCAMASVFFEIYARDFNLHFDISSKWQFVFRIFPLYVFNAVFSAMYTISITDLVCQDKEIALISIELENCTIVPSCCDYNLMPATKDLVKNLVSITVVSFVAWIIVVWNECSRFWHWQDIPSDDKPTALEDHKKAHSLIPTASDNSDAIYERIKVNSLKPQERNFSTVICQQVGKIYNNVSVVSRISFYLEPYVLQRPNSAGKSTLLKLLVGDEKLSYGRAYIKNVDMSTSPGHARKYIGYSPSTSCLNRCFTIYEMLKLFILLQGIDREEVAIECENLARIMGLLPHYRKKLHLCSQGILVRTHHAIAILSKPSVLCLDLPTAHIDIAASRQLWNVLTELRYHNGTTIIFTTSNPRECERFCTKVAIMQNGRFDSIGSPAEVSKKHPPGYCIFAKLKRSRELTANPFLQFTTFMELNFPTSVLREYFCKTIVYYVPQAANNMASIFETVKPKQNDLDLETFSVTNELLSMIYMDTLENEKFAVSRRLRDL